jgi:NTE family protein
MKSVVMLHCAAREWIATAICRALNQGADTGCKMRLCGNVLRSTLKRRLARAAAVCVIAGGAAACTTIGDPLNEAITSAPNQALDALDAGSIPVDDTIIGLSFSGGGTRAAAFSFGVLKEMATVSHKEGDQSRSLVEQVDFVSGVSGGSVTAAYFALKGPAALADFRERFLIANVEGSLRTSVTPGNVARLIGGGVNDAEGLPAWLNQNLFNGATFGDVLRKRRPILWVNASDIYNRSPFIFDRETFAALCSNIDNYPLANAVAASAAVPLVFAPVAIQNHAKRCDYRMPSWTAGALQNTNAPANLKAYAKGLQRYREDQTLNFVKLLDGGLADNFGLQGFSLARARAQDPYAPLTPQQAVNLKRMLFLVVDAGRPVRADFQKTLGGHSGFELVMAATDTAIDSTVRLSFDSFTASMTQWQNEIIRYRCGLPAAQVQRMRKTMAGWNCRDIKFFVGKVAFEQVNDPELFNQLAEIKTSLSLPAQQVDRLIDAARTAMRQNPAWNNFVQSLSGKPLDTSGLATLTLSRGEGRGAPLRMSTQ